MQLAIDTSTDTASIALVNNGEVLAELSWRCGQNHTTELLANLDYILDIVGVDIQSIESIVVAKGPGSYNGLRVGISNAKGLAFSLGIPVVGISTFEVEAYQHADTLLPVCPIYNAGRGEIATATFQKKDNQWQQYAAEHITTLDALYPQISTKTVFCGEYIPSIAAELKEKLMQNALIPTSSANIRRAAFLAELGQIRLKAGNIDDPATLQPIYLRQPPITTPRPRLINQYGGKQ